MSRILILFITVIPLLLKAESNIVKSKFTLPITSVEQIVWNSDIECLDHEAMNIPVSKNLKYIGMLSSMKLDSINFEQWKEDIHATLKMGNIQGLEFIRLDNDPDLVKSMHLFKEKLIYLSQFKVGIILIVQELLFDKNGHPVNQYSKLWKKLNYMLFPFRGLIKGIYLYDEPFWNVEVNKRNNNLEYVNEEQMYNNLTLVGSLIKKSFTKVSLAYVEAYTMINENLKIPDVFDWIGMDCYTGFSNCEGKSIPEYYRILKKLKPGKKLGG